MPLSLEQFLERVADLTDPPYLCEVLEITYEEIIERFSDLVEQKDDVLREIFDVDLGIEQEGELDE